MTSAKPKVAVLMGSDSDLPVMKKCLAELTRLEVPFDIVVASAHRTPDRVAAYVRKRERDGVLVFSCAAGGAAHLAGAVAAQTTLPVLGVPIAVEPFKGLDALLSTVQMPPGVPVATMAIGPAGAKNAAIFAAQILALSDPRLQERLKRHKEDLEQKVAQQADQIPAEFRRKDS